MSFLDTSSFSQMLVALGVVLALLSGVARFARPPGTMLRPGGGRLSIRAACALDARRRLVLIACDGREGLLLTGPAGDQFLGWLPAA